MIDSYNVLFLELFVIWILIMWFIWWYGHKKEKQKESRLFGRRFACVIIKSTRHMITERKYNRYPYLIFGLILSIWLIIATIWSMYGLLSYGHFINHEKMHSFEVPYPSEK
jgi:hypothetical protein